MAPSQQKKGLKDVRNGALLQMAEAASLGLPFEVWKTRMGRFRSESNFTAFRNVYNSAGGGLKGVKAFWAGFSPKMVESATKGAVLMVAKEAINDVTLAAGASPFVAATIAGAGGGVCQVAVMGPCTYVVTAAVTTSSKDNPKTAVQIVRETYQRCGIRGFYPGGSAIALRQATNWASRQGLTELVRNTMRNRKQGESKRLSTSEEIVSGIIGGALSCWNHPFEVARIEMQARANAQEARLGMISVFQLVVKEHGMQGLFKGVLPRICLGIWQTLFMVSSIHIIGARKS